jgi:uroporphyrin-3 C-methyltransferase
LLVKLDEISRLVEDLPVVNTVTPFVRVEKANVSANAASKIATSKPSETSPVNDWQTTAQDFWQRNWLIVRTELVKLVRVSRIENPEAVLLTPEQTYFLRENLKLKILNARLGLLGRQIQSAKADMSAVADDLRKYSDPTSKQAQLLQAAVAQVQAQLGSAAIPGLDTSLAALALAAAGK